MEMEQTEIEKQVSQIKKKHYCANNKSVGEQFTDALIEALSLIRSIPTKVTDEEIEKEYKKLWDDKPIGTITSFGWVAGAKWMRDKLPITLSLPESKNVPSEEKRIKGLSIEFWNMEAEMWKEESEKQYKQAEVKNTRIQELEGKLKEAKEEMKFHAVKLLSFYIINTHRDDETLEDIYERFIKF